MSLILPKVVGMFDHFCGLDNVHVFFVFRHDYEAPLTVPLIHHHYRGALCDTDIL